MTVSTTTVTLQVLVVLVWVTSVKAGCRKFSMDKISGLEVLHGDYVAQDSINACELSENRLVYKRQPNGYNSDRYAYHNGSDWMFGRTPCSKKQVTLRVKSSAQSPADVAVIHWEKYDGSWHAVPVALECADKDEALATCDYIRVEGSKSNRGAEGSYKKLQQQCHGKPTYKQRQGGNHIYFYKPLSAWAIGRKLCKHPDVAVGNGQGLLEPSHTWNEKPDGGENPDFRVFCEPEQFQGCSTLRFRKSLFHKSNEGKFDLLESTMCNGRPVYKRQSQNLFLYFYGKHWVIGRKSCLYDPRLLFRVPDGAYYPENITALWEEAHAGWMLSYDVMLICEDQGTLFSVSPTVLAVIAITISLLLFACSGWHVYLMSLIQLMYHMILKSLERAIWRYSKPDDDDMNSFQFHTLEEMVWTEDDAEVSKNKNTHVLLSTETDPFARGGMRYAYKAHVVNRNPRHASLAIRLAIGIFNYLNPCVLDPEKMYVVKSVQASLVLMGYLSQLTELWQRTLKVSEIKAMMIDREINCQLYAAEMARKFKRVVRNTRFGDVPSVLPVYKLTNPDGEDMTLEPFCEGEFTKTNSNTGDTLEDSDVGRKRAALSHWCLAYTKYETTILDVQGVGLKLTDPEIATTDEYLIEKLFKNKMFMEAGNIGDRAILQFMKKHKCSKYCKMAGLQDVWRACPSWYLERRYVDVDRMVVQDGVEEDDDDDSEEED